VGQKPLEGDVEGSPDLLSALGRCIGDL